MTDDTGTRDVMSVQDIAAMLHWVTGGFGATNRGYSRVIVTKWYLWNLETVRVYDSDGTTVIGERLTEVCQRVPAPQTWSRGEWYGRIASALDDLGGPWGVGAVTQYGEGMRVTLGTPGRWRVMDRVDVAVAMSSCQWQTMDAVGILCHGDAYVGADRGYTVPSLRSSVVPPYNSGGGDGPRAA